MATCDYLIKQGIAPDCSDPIVGGIEANGVIINRKDIDYSATMFDATRKNIIKTLVLKTGKKAFDVYVPSPTPFTGTITTMEKGTNRNTFTNDLGFTILDNSPDVCEGIIDGLMNGEFVVVYENKYKNINKATTPGDSTFQIVGYYQGLKAETIENDKYSEDTEGGWSVLLKETKVPKSALFFYNTDITTTRTQIDSLKA